MNPFSFRSLNCFIASVLQRYICFKGIQGGIRKQTVYMLPLVYKNSFIDILHELGKNMKREMELLLYCSWPLSSNFTVLILS